MEINEMRLAVAKTEVEIAKMLTELSKTIGLDIQNVDVDILRRASYDGARLDHPAFNVTIKAGL